MRYLFTLIMLLSITTMAFSQKKRVVFEDFKNEKQRLFFGQASFGINATQIDGDGYGGYDKVGIVGGVGLTVFFKEKWTGSLEMLYSRKGSVNRRIDESPYAGSYFAEYIAKVNVIEMPLAITYYHFPKRWAFTAGVAFNILIDEMEDFGYYYQPDINIPPSFERFSMDALVGLKYNFYGKYFIGAKFQYGITPMRKVGNTPLDVNYGRHQVNNQLSFSLSYLF